MNISPESSNLIFFLIDVTQISSIINNSETLNQAVDEKFMSSEVAAVTQRNVFASRTQCIINKQATKQARHVK